MSISIIARAQAHPNPNRSLQQRPNHAPETHPEQDACTYHLVRVSRNRKTGPIPVTTTSANSCPPTCGFKDNGCYAQSGPLAIHWKWVSEGRRGYSFDELLQEIATLRRHALWRHNQAGDLTPEAPGVIDSRRLTRLAMANRGRRGFTYTHYLPTPANRIAIRQANQLGFTVNLSAESLRQADEYLDHGVAPVVVALPSNAANATRTPAGHHVIVCPASTGNTDCLNCGICQQRDRASVVGFPAHGSGAKRVEEIFFKEVRP